MSFLGEIKRRMVLRVTAIYAVIAWLLVQIVATVESPLRLPKWVDTLVISRSCGVCFSSGGLAVKRGWICWKRQPIRRGSIRIRVSTGCGRCLACRCGSKA